jgi:hypothetical protein
MNAPTLEIGKSFTTTKSGYVGVVAEIVANPNGSNSVRFESGRWTTV